MLVVLAATVSSSFRRFPSNVIRNELDRRAAQTTTRSNVTSGWSDKSWDDQGPNDDTAESKAGGTSDEFTPDDDPVPLATFQVVGDRIVGRTVSATNFREANAIWTRFVELIPADRRTMVSQFELQSSDYDGAYVYRRSGRTTWALGVQAGMEDLDLVLVHEFGHLLTLNSTEFVDVSSRKCTTYFSEGDGCARTASVAERFVGEFWDDEMIREAISDDNQLAAEYPSEFVDDYAATNPTEDMAETFATFVLTGRPSGDSVADDKIWFFWSDADMVALRAQIRANGV